MHPQGMALSMGIASEDAKETDMWMGVRRDFLCYCKQGDRVESLLPVAHTRSTPQPCTPSVFLSMENMTGCFTFSIHQQQGLAIPINMEKLFF